MQLEEMQKCKMSKKKPLSFFVLNRGDHKFYARYTFQYNAALVRFANSGRNKAWFGVETLRD